MSLSDLTDFFFFIHRVAALTKLPRAVIAESEELQVRLIIKSN